MIVDYSASPVNYKYHTFTQEEMPFLQEEFKPDFFINMDAIGIDKSSLTNHRPFTYNSVNANQGRFMFYDKEEKTIYTRHDVPCPISYLILEYVKEDEYLPVPEPTGAFRNAAKLKKIYIPESVKFIGAEAFRFTALKTAKIAADCEYSETSFPEGCKLEFYENSETYGQLYDCDGYAVLDCEGARIYVK